MTAAFLKWGLALCQLLSLPSDKPPHCVNSICVLTGNGGDVDRWTEHVDQNHGALFRVEGICAGACMAAVQYAVIRGERIRLTPGYQLQPHEALPLKGP